MISRRTARREEALMLAGAIMEQYAPESTEALAVLARELVDAQCQIDTMAEIFASMKIDPLMRR